MALLVLSPLAHATTDTVSAVLHCPPSMWARYAAELRAIGVQPMPPAAGTSTTLQDLRSDARQRGAKAVVWLAADLQRVTVALVADAGTTHHTLSRGRHEAAGTLALRAAELLHALLSAPAPKAAPQPPRASPPAVGPASPTPAPSTTPAPTSPSPTPKVRGEPTAAPSPIGRRTGSPSKEAPKATPSRPEAPSPARKGNASEGEPTQAALPAAATLTAGAAAPEAGAPASWWSTRVGALVDGGPGGLGAAAKARLAMSRSLPGARDWALSVLVEMPLTDHEVKGAAGASALDTWVAGAELRWRAWQRQRWAVWAEGGGGVTFLSATGQPRPGYAGTTTDMRAAAGWLGGAAEVQLSGPVFARFEAGVLMVGPKPVVVADGAAIASWGRPTLRVALTLELRP